MQFVSGSCSLGWAYHFGIFSSAGASGGGGYWGGGTGMSQLASFCGYGNPAGSSAVSITPPPARLPLPAPQV